MDPLQKVDISRISSNEIIKNIFSNLNSKRILKIVQKNKNLQQKLGISLEHYKSRSDLPKYEYIEEKSIFRKRITDSELSYMLHNIILTCCTFIFFAYTF